MRPCVIVAEFGSKLASDEVAIWDGSPPCCKVEARVEIVAEFVVEGVVEGLGSSEAVAAATALKELVNPFQT